MVNKRRVPRPFTMPWGKGMVTEEVGVDLRYYTPTIQLLEYEGGEKALRFCVYHGQAFSRVPLIIDEENMNLLSKEVAGNAKIRKMLKKLVR